MNNLLDLIRIEEEFIWEHSDEFSTDLCHGYDIVSVAFNSENVHVNMCDMKSGQHLGYSYSIDQYFDWKNKITLE